MKKISILTLAAAISLAVIACSDGNPSLQAPTPEKEVVSKTNDGKDVVVFNKGDLDEVLFKIDTVYITDSSFLGKLYFRNLAESKIPEPGDIIASSITEIAPYGFLYRVTEVAKEGENVTIVSVIYASIAEAVEEADIEINVPFVYNDEGVLEAQVLSKKCSGVWSCTKSFFKNNVVDPIVSKFEDLYNKVETVVKAIGGTVDGGKTDKRSFSVNEEKSFSSSSGNAKLSGSVKLEGSYDLLFTARIKIKDYRIKHTEISISQDAYMKLAGNLKGNLKYSKNIEIKKFPLPDIEFVIVVIPVVITNNITIKAKVEANAQVNLNAELGFSNFSKFGFEYDGSNFKRINICETKSGFDYNYSAYGDVRLGLLLGLESMLYGIGGLELSAGPSVVLSQQLPLSAKSSTKLHSDLDINLSAKIDIAGVYKTENNFGKERISLGDLFSSKTFPSFNFNLPDMKTDGKLSFPFEISKEKLGFSFLESGFCIEDKDGECIKGPNFGNLGNIVDSSVNFEGLKVGTEYGIVPFFKDLDGEYHYLDAVKFVYGVLNSSSSLASSSSIAQSACPNAVTDNGSVSCGGKTYRTVQIGTQTWIAEDMNYDVPGSKCYNNDPGNCVIYGRLYDWAMAMALPDSCNRSSCENQINSPHKGICPSGWHIPVETEWDKLMRFVYDDMDVANEKPYEPYERWKLGRYLNARNRWTDCGPSEFDKSFLCEDTYGFSALPNIGATGAWWSPLVPPTTSSNFVAYYRYIINSGYSYRNYTAKTEFHGVRCLKD